MFHAHAKTIAKRFMVLFSVLFICGAGVGIGGLVIMSEFDGQTIQFWIGLLMAFISVFTIFWTVTGFIINAMNYTSA